MLDSVKWSKNEYMEYIIKRVTSRSSSNTVVPITCWLHWWQLNLAQKAILKLEAES